VNLQQLADSIGGTLYGDPSFEVTTVAPLESASAGDLTFALEKSSLKAIQRSQASAIITFKKFEAAIHQIVVTDPKKSMIDILNQFYPSSHPFDKTSSTAIISKETTIDASVLIHHYSIIEKGTSIGKNSIIYNHVSIGENVTIGEGCIIYPHVTLYNNVTIGNNVIIHAGTVIGADGFGFHLVNGVWEKVPQVGGVQLKDNVEIQSNSAVDRGTMGDTIVGSGTKIDNLVHIAHNSTIGHSTVIAAQVGCTGSSKIGNYVAIGGQVGIDATEIEDQARVGGKSAVTKRVKAGTVVSGSPAQDHIKELKQNAFIRKLVEKEG